MDNELKRSPVPPKIRLTMWDWSWLSHRVPGGAFEDWERVVDEARERGFDTIRFDPLPDLVAVGDEPEAVTIVPAECGVPWMHVPAAQTVDPLAEALAFAHVAAEAGMRLVLSSWGFGRGRVDGTVRFGDYPAFVPMVDDEKDWARYLAGWDRVLTAFAGEGLLPHVVYVDLNNELDLVVALASSAVRALPERDGVWDWTDTHGRVLRDLSEWGISWLHREHPQVAATISCCGPVDLVGPWFPRNADYLEWHSWYSEPDRPAWEERVAELFDGGKRPPATGDFATAEQRRRLDAVYRRAHAAAGPVLRRQQDAYLGRIKRLADERGLPAVIGEGYATPMYSPAPELSWSWVREVSAAAARTTRRLGFDGWTTSNFSEPTFPLWADVDWHRPLLAEA